MTFTANNVTGLDFDVAEPGYIPIGVIQQQFKIGSGVLAITNCIVSGDKVLLGVMNRDGSSRTTTLKIVVLYRAIA